MNPEYLIPSRKIPPFSFANINLVWKRIHRFLEMERNENRNSICKNEHFLNGHFHTSPSQYLLSLNSI